MWDEFGLGLSFHSCERGSLAGPSRGVHEGPREVLEPRPACKTRWALPVSASATATPGIWPCPGAGLSLPAVRLTVHAAFLLSSSPQPVEKARRSRQPFPAPPPRESDSKIESRFHPVAPCPGPSRTRSCAPLSGWLDTATGGDAATPSRSLLSLWRTPTDTRAERKRTACPRAHPNSGPSYY